MRQFETKYGRLQEVILLLIGFYRSVFIDPVVERWPHTPMSVSSNPSAAGSLTC